MFSPWAPGGYFYMMYLTSFISSGIMAFVYIFPFIQIFITNERRKWLEKHFEHTPSSGENEDVFRKQLLDAATPAQPFPIYKMLKFYLTSSGITGVVIGLLIMILPESILDESGMKVLIFIPTVIGVSIYFLYKRLYPGHGLWRELAGFFLLLGVAITSIGVYDLYELYEYIRSDLFLYALLGFGLFVMHYLNSTIASYLYIALVIFGSNFVSSEIGYNWMMFMSHFIWFFALGVLSFWLPRLRAAKQIEFREVLFAILFFAMIMRLGMNNTSGLGPLACAVLLPCLYIFSKVHFRHASWFGARPIELITIMGTIVWATAFSIPEIVESVNEGITLFSNFSFHKLFAFVLIGIAGVIGYTMYADQHDDIRKQINPLIVFSPLAAFLLLYLLGGYGTQYLMNIFLLYLGVDYLRKGLLARDSAQLILATVAIMAALFVRLADLADYLEEQFILGFVVMLFGFIFTGLALYMREKWTVTGTSGTQNELTGNESVVPLTSENQQEKE